MTKRQDSVKENIKEFLRSFEKSLLEAASELIDKTMPELDRELFSDFHRTGNRLRYERPYFQRRKFLSVFAILSIFYNRHEYINKLEYVIDCICSEECWALPAHVSLGADGWENTVDLFSAETAAYLAEIITLLDGRLSDSLCRRAADEVKRRVLAPFIHSQPFSYGWESAENNWCAVCCGSVGIAAYYLIKDKAVLDGLFDRLTASLESYLRGFSNDGACLEGLGYYTYGLSFYTAFSELILSYSDGKRDILSNEKMKNIALFQKKCHLSRGITVSFSDALPHESFRVGLTAYLSLRFPGVSFPDFSAAADFDSDNCYRYLILSRDVVFARRYLQEASNREASLSKSSIGEHIVLPDAMWSICKSENKAALAAKGGNNGEPHNHNDIGSFQYIFSGNNIVLDIGAGEYTGDYFGKNRYQTLCCRSLGHSVPIINGSEQLPGANHCATLFEADGRGRTVIGLERAYKLSKGDRVRRILDFDLLSGRLRITDDFSISKGGSITENLVLAYPPEILSDGFLVEAPSCVIRIKCENGRDFRIVEKSYTDHFGKNAVVWLAQWSLTENRAVICFDPGAL